MWDVLDAQLRAIANHTTIPNWTNMVRCAAPRR